MQDEEDFSFRVYKLFLSDTSRRVQPPDRGTTTRGTGDTGAGGQQGGGDITHFYTYIRNYFSDERDHYDLRTNKYDAPYLNNCDQAILDDFQYNA